MESLSTALGTLLTAATASNKLKPAIKDSLQHIKACLNLLNLYKPSAQIIDKICTVLREPLMPLYTAFPELTLALCSQIFSSISDKISTLKERGEESQRIRWQGAQRSLLSGVLDFLEGSRTAKNKEAIAIALYHKLCAAFFPLKDSTATAAETNLLSTVSILLSESATAHPSNLRKLRNDSILGGERLGALISRTRDFLALESLLNLFATLLPSTNNTKAGRDKRLAFIKCVFESGSPRHFSCGTELTRIMQNVQVSDWEATSTKIIDALSRNDITFPQPFKISQIHACGLTFAQPNAGDRLYLDTRSFFANIDSEGDACETFQALYSHISEVVIASSTTVTLRNVTVHLTHPPVIGATVMSRPNSEHMLLQFDINASDVERFTKTIKARRLKNSMKATRVKQSLCESTSLEFDDTGNAVHEMSAKERIETIGRIFDEVHGDSFLTSEPPNSCLDDSTTFLATMQLEKRGASSPVATVDPRQICQPVATPTKPVDMSPIVLSVKSPLYESVFGGSDDELSGLSEEETWEKDPKASMVASRTGRVDNKKALARSTNQKLRTTKARKIIESDIESVGEGSAKEGRKDSNRCLLDEPNLKLSENTVFKASSDNKREQRASAADDPPARSTRTSQNGGRSNILFADDNNIDPSQLSGCLPQKCLSAQRGRLTIKHAEPSPAREDSIQRLREVQDAGQPNHKQVFPVKRRLSNENQVLSEPLRASKRRRGEAENGDTPVRKPSIRTAALLESPKKPVRMARRYGHKGRSSSPIIEESSMPVVDFDDIPSASSIQEVRNTRGRRLSQMKTKTGQKVSRQRMAAKNAKDMPPAMASTEDVKAPVGEGTKPNTGSETQAQKPVQAEIKKAEKPQQRDPQVEIQSAAAKAEVGVGAKGVSVSPELLWCYNSIIAWSLGLLKKLSKSNKLQKAPWQESSFLKKLPHVVQSKSFPGSDIALVSEVPNRDAPPMIDHSEFSIPVESTSEDNLLASVVTDNASLTIDLTEDSPIRTVPSPVNVGIRISERAIAEAPAEETKKLVIKSQQSASVPSLGQAKEAMSAAVEVPKQETSSTRARKVQTAEEASKSDEPTVNVHKSIVPPAVSRIQPKPHVRIHSPSTVKTTTAQENTHCNPRDISPVPRFRNEPTFKIKSMYKQSPSATRIVYPHKRYNEASYVIKRDESPLKGDAMDDIMKILDELHEVVVRKVTERFSGVTKEVREGRDIILHEASADLEKMRIERYAILDEISDSLSFCFSVIHFNNIVGLEEEYSGYRRKLLGSFNEMNQTCQLLDEQLRWVIHEHDKHSLSKLFPTSLFARSAGLPKWEPF